MVSSFREIEINFDLRTASMSKCALNSSCDCLATEYMWNSSISVYYFEQFFSFSPLPAITLPIAPRKLISMCSPPSLRTKFFGHCFGVHSQLSSKLWSRVVGLVSEQGLLAVVLLVRKCISMWNRCMSYWKDPCQSLVEAQLMILQDALHCTQLASCLTMKVLGS